MATQVETLDDVIYGGRGKLPSPQQSLLELAEAITFSKVADIEPIKSTVPNVANTSSTTIAAPKASAPKAPAPAGTPVLSKGVQNFRNWGTVGRAVSEDVLKNTESWKPVIQGAAGSAPLGQTLTQNKDVISQNVYRAIQATPGLNRELAAQHGGGWGKTLAGAARWGIPGADRLINSQIQKRLPGVLAEQGQNILPQGNVPAPVENWSDPLKPAAANYALNNMQSIRNIPGAAAKMTAVALEQAPLQRVANQYQQYIQPHVSPFIQQNQATAGKAVEGWAQQGAAAGDTTARLANTGLNVADYFGAKPQAAQYMAKQFGPMAFKQYANSQAPGTPGVPPPQSGFGKLLSNIGFTTDPNKGYISSFMNNPANSKFRMGAAGGLGAMALLWMLSRMFAGRQR